jgi:MFS family permease
MGHKQRVNSSLGLKLEPVTLLSLAFSFIFAGFSGSQQFITNFFTVLGQPNLGFYSLILIYTAFILANPIAAMVVNKWGARWSMIGSGIWYAIFILTLTTHQIWLIGLSSIFLGAAAAFLWTGNATYLVRISQGQNYGRNAGWFGALLATGQALGIILSGMIVNRWSYQMAFLGSAALATVGWMLLWGLPSVMAPKSNHQLALMRRSFGSITARKLSLIWLSFNLVSGLVISLVPLILAQKLGSGFVGLSAIFYVMPIVSTYALGKLVDSYGRSRVVLLAFISGIAGLALLLLTNSAVTIVAGLALVALTNATVFPVTLALLGDVTSSDNLAVITASFWMVQNIGVVMALLLSSRLSTDQVFWVSALVLGLALLIVYPVVRQPAVKLKALIKAELNGTS